MKLNPNNYKYHEGLRSALQLDANEDGRQTAEQLQRLAELYQQLAELYPHSSAVHRIPLDFKARPGLGQTSELLWSLNPYGG
jgi:hypothetical protein